MSTMPERWIVRRAPPGWTGWEARHCPPNSNSFDDQNVGVYRPTFTEAAAVVPDAFCQAIGPRDPEAKEGAEARVMFMMIGDWEFALRDHGIDPAAWFETGEAWLRPITHTADTAKAMEAR